jgi:hypothetical protein
MLGELIGETRGKPGYAGYRDSGHSSAGLGDLACRPKEVIF